MEKLVNIFEAKYFEYHNFDEINFQFNQNNIFIKNNIGQVSITILGSDIDDIFKTMYLIEDLFYIILGYFPKLISSHYNDQLQGIANRASKFYSCEQNIYKPYLTICDISQATINENALYELEKIKKISLYSLQYLTCNDYESITSTHKVILLFHTIDGVYNEIEKNENAKYRCKVEWLCNNYFFNYNSLQILSLINATDDKFVSSIADTRNWYSHFLIKDKPDKIEDGEENILYFYLVSYMIRLAIFNKINPNKLDKTIINEYYSTIYDWYANDVLKLNLPLTSKAYKSHYAFKQLNNFLSSSNNTNINK